VPLGHNRNLIALGHHFGHQAALSSGVRCRRRSLSRPRRARARAREVAGNQRPWPADKVERWSIDRLIPYAKNARTHADAQVAAIAASIKEDHFGANGDLDAAAREASQHTTNRHAQRELTYGRDDSTFLDPIANARTSDEAAAARAFDRSLPPLRYGNTAIAQTLAMAKELQRRSDQILGPASGRARSASTARVIDSDRGGPLIDPAIAFEHFRAECG
jgi:hypothetical protein